MRTSRRVTSPLSSSMATRTSSRSARNWAVRAVSWSGEAMLRPNRPTEARPSPRRRSSQSGAVVPVKPGWRTVSASRVSPSSAELDAVVPLASVVIGWRYPFTAPAVSPAAILRWTMRNRTTIGTAIIVEPAIIGAYSVPCWVVKLPSQTVAVWFFWLSSIRA